MKLGDIADVRFLILLSMLPFRGVSVCLSDTFVHCAQMAKDIDKSSFAYNSLLSPQIVLKFGLHRSILLP